MLALFTAGLVAFTVPNSLWSDLVMPASGGKDGNGEFAGQLFAERQLAEGVDPHRTWLIIDPLIRLAVFFLIMGIEFVGSMLYWHWYIRNSSNNYVPVRAIVPADLKGNWAHELCDCCAEPGTCLCFAFCPSWAIADLWYRAGWIHGLMGRSAEQQPCNCCNGCPGWQFFVGLIGFHILASCPCGTPCGLAISRGGARFVDGNDGGLGEVIDHRKRFELPHTGWGTFFTDCCLWCWCIPCVGTQEYRQIMTLLGRGPLQQEVMGQPVVGNPVAIKAQENA